eukprot:TRINITY_DN5079_c0_g1_i1.p1 TRINITY_DN5079_c0_g1~~TRINITY_DN5079_c0_g1_i1.p1  ORF type:complete len:388 (-),score=68.88 TRINITY_DN5079_c0_g1_i1:76-1239(-)
MAAIREALNLLSSEPWDVQEAAYVLLIKVIQNPLQSPDEPKFRSIKRDSAALKNKLLDRRGGVQVLLAVGFIEEASAYVLPRDASLDVLREALQEVKSHAEKKQMDHQRAERDEKIAKAKAEEAELAKFGGFARGIHKLGRASVASGTAEVADSRQLPTPVTNAFSMHDPRRPGEKVGMIAFYYPGRELPWDRVCQAGFLGNFYPQPPGEDIKFAPPSFPDQEHSFNNTEAAFQALKHWRRANEFEGVDGGGAFHLKKKYNPEADMSYGGYGSNWKGMLAVLRLKFKAGTACAQALCATGEAFLLEHNEVSGRDKVWSDNQEGDGTNWLGLQLMLIRDELNNATGHEASWTAFFRSRLNLETGCPCNNQWQEAVKAATDVVLASCPS